MKNRQLQKIGLLLAVALIFSLAATQILAQDPANLIKNGGFEEGFVEGLGVANEWNSFHSDNVDPGFYDDSWSLVVAEGEHAQLLELIDSTEMDTYAGIYQTVSVKAGQTYQFSFKGLVRSDEGSIDDSNYGYRMQYAIDQSGNEDWQKVTDWVELPWDEQPRTAPADGAYTIGSMETTFTATGDTVTVFIRAWKKWVDNHEGNYDIDAVQLIPVETTEPLPETGGLLANPASLGVIAVGSLALIVVLLGGAYLNQKRRRV